VNFTRRFYLICFRRMFGLRANTDTWAQVRGSIAG